MDIRLFFPLFIALESILGADFNWDDLNLLDRHIPYVFHHQPELKQQCIEDPSCPFKKHTEKAACWGFEPGCKNEFGKSYPTLDCLDGNSKKRYWHQADFGYVQKYLKEMKSGEICKSTKTKPSSLRCTRDSRLCKAKYLYMDLRSVENRIVRQNKVVLEQGEIGGYCDLDQAALDEETKGKRPLGDWGEQLAPYTQLSFDPFENPKKHCDEVVETPVYFVQLDATGNMYHHFCDFFNLYVTQLTNNSWFGTENKVVRWEYSKRLGDTFEASWKVFTNKYPISLHNFGKKRICFSEVVFSLLPRMAGGGLYYSTYVEERCRGSSLFRAFSQHFLHRMNIIDANLVPTSLPRREDSPNKIRVTLLDRNHTNKYKIFRIVLNQEELVEAIKKIPNLDVKVYLSVLLYSKDLNHYFAYYVSPLIQVYSYSRAVSFEEQLAITHNTDIFIGMHGAGLTHIMFLPEWAIAFELYNCKDIRCYRDLALLLGHRYLTWEDETKVFEHGKGVDGPYNYNPKYWNFSFDVEEFVRLVRKAISWLVEHPRFAHLKTQHQEL